MRQIDRDTDVVCLRYDAVSPYLRRRLRSYEEAVRQRGDPTLADERPQAIRSATPDAARLIKTASSRSDR